MLLHPSLYYILISLLIPNPSNSSFFPEDKEGKWVAYVDAKESKRVMRGILLFGNLFADIPFLSYIAPTKYKLIDICMYYCLSFAVKVYSTIVYVNFPYR